MEQNGQENPRGNPVSQSNLFSIPPAVFLVWSQQQQQQYPLLIQGPFITRSPSSSSSSHVSDNVCSLLSASNPGDDSNNEYNSGDSLSSGSLPSSIVYHQHHHFHHYLHNVPHASQSGIPGEPHQLPFYHYEPQMLLKTTQFAPSILGLKQQQQQHPFHPSSPSSSGLKKIPPQEQFQQNHKEQPAIRAEEYNHETSQVIPVVNQSHPDPHETANNKKPDDKRNNIDSNNSAVVQINDSLTSPRIHLEDRLLEDDEEDEDAQAFNNGMWWKHLVSGGLAGAVSRTCTAPLDRIKVFLQVRGSEFNSILLCVKHLLSEGGVLSLWRGNGMNVVKIAPETALKFWAYEEAKIFQRGNIERELNISERFLAGSIAGSASQTVIYPMEVLKTRLCLRTTGQYRGAIDAAKKIYAAEGLKAFYRGYVPNLLGIIPYAGIDLAVYETLKNYYLSKYSNGEDPNALVFLACGTISSSCGQLASYPLALVRTRLQAQVGVSSKDETIISLFRNIIQTEGYRGLYRGITPNFLKVAPAVSISYVVYEHARKSLGATMT